MTSIYYRHTYSIWSIMLSLPSLHTSNSLSPSLLMLSWGKGTSSKPGIVSSSADDVLVSSLPYSSSWSTESDSKLARRPLFLCWSILFFSYLDDSFCCNTSISMSPPLKLSRVSRCLLPSRSSIALLRANFECCLWRELFWYRVFVVSSRVMDFLESRIISIPFWGLKKRNASRWNTVHLPTRVTLH